MDALLPVPRVCAVCLHSPCLCPDVLDLDEDQADQDFIDTLQRAMDATEEA